MLENLLTTLNLTQDQLIQIAIATALAATPAVIWFIVIFKGRKSSRWPLLLAFFLGTLTVLPLMGLEYLWMWYPDLDIYKAIETNITEAHFSVFVALVVVGMLEELTKSGVVRFIDKTRIGIQTINDAVKYSILAGLGFAFIENIFYFYYIWQSSGFAGLLAPLIFRSIFTVCAHAVFSGILGYFYGIAKFAKPIVETKLWMGEKSHGAYFLSKFLGTNEANAFRQIMLIKGLIIAMMMHAFFNFFLDFQMLTPVVILVGGGFAYLLYLLAHKAGAIAFGTMNQSTSNSNMAKQDQDVVLELLGMWTNEGRYKDVTDICQRLLMRDPDNKVVKLFQAKAMDKQKLANLEKSLTSLFSSNDKIQDEATLRTLVKQKVLMEMLQEKQGGQTSSAGGAGANSSIAAPAAPTKTRTGTESQPVKLVPGQESAASANAPAPAPAPAPKIPTIPTPTPRPSAGQNDQSSQQ